MVARNAGEVLMGKVVAFCIENLVERDYRQEPYHLD